MGTRQQERRWEYLRDTGRPSLLRHETPEVQWALRKIRSYNARGMSMSAMARQVGMAEDAVTRLFRQERPGLRRSTFEKIRKIEFDGQEGQLGQVSALGAQRRLRALRADGFPYGFLCEQMGHEATSPWLLRIITGWRAPGKPVGFIIGSTARQVERLYDKFAGVDPRDVGISEFAVKYSVGRARKSGYAPSGCWDPDTIDDPEAIPQWTGRCGTTVGYRVHKMDGIPLCGPCEQAGPGEWKFSGSKLRALREARGDTLQAVERAMGLTKGHCHHWEAGRYGPRPAVLVRLMSYFDVTFEDLHESEEV